MLDEDVARFGLHGDASPSDDAVLRVPDDSWIVNNPRTNLLFQEGGCQEAHHILTQHKLAGLIKEEAAIDITIKGDPKFRCFSLYHVSRGRMNFWQKWIGDAI